MSPTWASRKSRLITLLNTSAGEEEEEGLALDRLSHGQSVIGKSAKTKELDSLRFGDRDLDVVGTLEYGQFGVIDVVTCYHDNRVYVRKSISKSLAQKTRDQCSPLTERTLLLRSTHWSPHLLCAYQTQTHLNLVMEYAEGGTLWDVLESEEEGKVKESDLKWWAGQCVSAIGWCHNQGFAHRDIKPHNFVLTPTSHILLIDFGSAAPLLPSHKIPKRHCLVPCGTCDYIAPEILRAHEEALVALEMDMDVPDASIGLEEEGYGKDVDWWSLGAMLYELAYGTAPFFANDIRGTYVRIMEHEVSLKFPKGVGVSAAFEDLLRGFLTDAADRLGRHHLAEITSHHFFEETNWIDLHLQSAPEGLHLPQFAYSTPTAPGARDGTPHPPSFHASPSPSDSDAYSQPFAFSALFLSSPASGVVAEHGFSTPGPGGMRRSVSGRGRAEESFIGFTWGPKEDAFVRSSADSPQAKLGSSSPGVINTPRPLTISSSHSTPYLQPPPTHTSLPTPRNHKYPFSTPLRTPFTLPRSTVRKPGSTVKRAVSDREAMKQLVDCVGMSARKKVLESGRKPRVLTLASLGRGSSLKKELRFDYTAESIRDKDRDSTVGQVIEYSPGNESDYTESEGPPSPSPSPRPGSAMSVLSRRSVTPTSSQRLGSVNTATMSTNTNTLSLPPTARPRSDSVPSQASDRTGKDFNIPNSVTIGRGVGEQTFTSGTLDAMEGRYVSIMGDIEDMERRLEYLMAQVAS